MKKTVNYRSNSNTLATSCEELTHWKRLWCWEGLGAGGEGDDRGWDAWMASLTRWTWVWVNSGSWWWTGRPGVLRFMGSQRVGHDWATDLIWSDGWFYTCIYYMFNTICMVSLWLEEKWSSIYRLWHHSHQTKGNLSHKIGFFPSSKSWPFWIYIRNYSHWRGKALGNIPVYNTNFQWLNKFILQYLDT